MDMPSSACIEQGCENVLKQYVPDMPVNPGNVWFVPLSGHAVAQAICRVYSKGRSRTVTP